MTGRTTCIIPFYNEGDRIFSVLHTITQLQQVAQVICVDDGSSDHTAEKIRQRFPQVEVKQLAVNQGKTAAIRHGLQFAQHEYILLMDADLQWVDRHEVDFALRTIEACDADMIILRRVNAPWFVKMDRGDVLFSGERVIRRGDLERVLKEDVSRYQIEIAINHYMIEHQKRVFWVPSSAFNTFKTQKMGLVDGFIKELDMFFDIVLFIGLQNYLRQIAMFARKQHRAYPPQNTVLPHKISTNRVLIQKMKTFFG